MDDNNFENKRYKRERLSSPRMIDASNSYTNPIVIIFKIIAIITFVLGFFGGLIFGNQPVISLYSSRTEFSFAVALTYWAVSFISGLMFLGFAEIIQLLQDIKNKK